MAPSPVEVAVERRHIYHREREGFNRRGLFHAGADGQTAERGQGEKANRRMPPGLEGERERESGVMSGGELMASSSSSSPRAESKIHPQIVCRASERETHHHLPPPSLFMRGFSERNPRTTDEDFTPSGLVGRQLRLRRIVVRGNTPHEQPGEIVPVTKPGHKAAIRSLPPLSR